MSYREDFSVSAFLSRGCAALLCCVSAPSLAQTSALPPVSDPPVLETIVVNADPFARTADALLQPTEILSGEDLDRHRGLTLGETLEHELGVSSADFGRGAGRPVIRGQGGPRVLLLENGLTAMDASDVSSDHAVSIDPAHAEQIEILKGPATLMYGSGAAAGVVNVVDGRLPTQVTPGAAAVLRGGYASNADERFTAGRLGYGLGRMQFGVEAAWQDADDYDGRDARRIDNSAVETRSGAVSAAHVGERGSLAASLGRFETQYGLPVEETAFIDLEQDRIDLEGRLLRPLRGLESVRLRVARGDYTHTEFEAPGEPGTVFGNEQIDTRLEAVHAPLRGWRGVIGVQTRDRDFSALGEEAFVPSSNSRALGLFVIQERATSFGRVELGLRRDRERLRPQDAPLPTRRFTPLSASAGAIIDLGAHDHLKLYATRAERAPVSEELYSNGAHLATGSFERGDARLGTETATNIEIGVDRHGLPLGWRLNLYAQDAADYVFQREVDAGLDADGGGIGAADGIADRVDEEGRFDPDGELLLVDYVSADARFWGAEGEISYGGTLAGAEWRVRGFGDLARGRVRGQGPLPRITPARVGAGLHLHRARWTASLDFTHVAAQDRIAALETRTSGHALLSADLDYALPAAGGALRLFLRGRNLLDEDARRHTSFIKDRAPLPGRSLVSGLEWQF